MKELTQKQIFDYLFNNGIENFVGVPDSTMKYFIAQGFKKNKILITTREDESIGIRLGAGKATAAHPKKAAAERDLSYGKWGKRSRDWKKA